MRLVPEWKAVLRKAWSIRLMLLAGVFSGLEVFVPLIEGMLEIPQGVFAGLSGLTTATAFVSRVVAQNSLPEKTP